MKQCTDAEYRTRSDKFAQSNWGIGRYEIEKNYSEAVKNALERHVPAVGPKVLEGARREGMIEEGCLPGAWVGTKWDEDEGVYCCREHHLERGTYAYGEREEELLWKG